MSLKTFCLNIGSNTLADEKQMEYNRHLMKSHKRMYDRSVLPDVECLVDGRVFQAHRIVLCCFSPFLEKKLLEADEKSYANKIYVSKIGAEAFAVLLRYMYVGNIDVNCNNFFGVYKAAFLLNMPDIQKECLQRIDGKDEIRTYLYSYVLLKKCGPQQDCEKQLELITNRFEETALSREFAELDVQYVLEILSAPIIGARSEIIVFLSALTWLNYNFGSRNIFTVNVMRCVRFSSMTMEEIVACYHPPFLPQVVEDPQVMMMLHKATCYIAAKSQGRESWFRQNASLERDLTLKGLPLVLWHKQQEETPPYTDEFEPPKRSPDVPKEEFIPTSWNITESVTKDRGTVLTVTEADDRDDSFEKSRLSDSVCLDLDLTFAVTPKMDANQLINTDDCIDICLKTGDPDHPPLDLEIGLRKDLTEPKKGRVHQTLKNIAGFLQGMTKTVASRTGQENRSLRKKRTKDAAAKIEKDSLRTEVLIGHQLARKCVSSSAESFVVTPSKTQSLAKDFKTDHPSVKYSSKDFYKDSHIFPNQLNSSISEGTKILVVRQQPNVSQDEDLSKRTSQGDGSSQTLPKRLEAEQDDDENLKTASLEAPLDQKEEEKFLDLAAPGPTETIAKQKDTEEEVKLPVTSAAKGADQQSSLTSKKEDKENLSIDSLDEGLLPTKKGKGNGLLLVVGGMSPKNFAKDYGSIVNAFDRTTDEWFRYGDIPKPRHNHSAVVMSHFLYVVGGCSLKDTIEKNKYIARPTCFRLDLKSNKWTTMASMKSPRFDHGMVAYKGLIYVFGGQVEINKLLKSVETYDPMRNRWTQLNSSMCCGRTSMGIAVFRDRIWIAGGLIENGDHKQFRVTSLVDCFNPVEKSWDYKTYSLSGPRCFCSLTVWDEKLFCIAGMAMTDRGRGVPTNEVWYVDNENEPWKVAPFLPKPNVGGVAVTYGDSLYFLGGFDPFSADDASKIVILTRGSATWKVGSTLESHLLGLAVVHFE